MSSNLLEYVRTVHSSTSEALKNDAASLSSILPCMVFRELAVLDSRFVSSSDPLMQSFFALRRNQQFPNDRVPRKIEFGTAVYLHEGLVDRLSTNDTAVVFVGDSNSDKRFAYNYERLTSVLATKIDVRCFISNSDLVSEKFGDELVRTKWDRNHFFYHADSWADLEKFTADLLQNHNPAHLVLVVDMDGTLLCPRPEYSGFIRDARLEALVRLCERDFPPAFFNRERVGDEVKLLGAYKKAERTEFGASFDDADLTALIALGIYAGIIDPDDEMMNPVEQRGFVLPVEFLDYALTVIENSPGAKPGFGELQALFGSCVDAIRSGVASSFTEFRVIEEKVLLDRATDGKVVINRQVVKFINELSGRGALAIGFSDRPNGSLGVVPSENVLAGTCKARSGNALINAVLPIR